MLRKVWKTMKNSTEETRMGKTKGRRSKERTGKKKKRDRVTTEKKRNRRKMKNTIGVKRLAEEQEIWNEEAEAKKSDKEAKKLVLE